MYVAVRTKFRRGTVFAYDYAVMFGRLPKWLSDLLFAILLIAAYFLGSIFVLPRLGVQT